MVKATAKVEGPMVLQRAFSLMRLLSEDANGVTLSEIATSLDAPKSSLSTTLKALTEQGYLNRKGALYFLGSESYALASAILAGRSIRQIARPFLEQTMESSGETVLLAVLDSDQQHCSYIDFVESPKSVRFSVEIGTRRPLYASAAGRLFLAHQPESLRRAYFETVILERRTENTITDIKTLESMLDEVRDTGVAITMGDYSADASGFAAPILDAEGKMVAALAIGVPLSRGQREKDKFTEAAIRAGKSLSRVLGHKEVI